MPMPRGTAFAKASGTPAISAVPQSGPMRSSPLSFARRLSARSSSSGTPEEKISAFSPTASALPCFRCGVLARHGDEREVRLRKQPERAGKRP